MYVNGTGCLYAMSFVNVSKKKKNREKKGLIAGVFRMLVVLSLLKM